MVEHNLRHDALLRRVKSALNHSLPMSTTVLFTAAAIGMVHTVRGLGHRDLHTMLEFVATLLALQVGILSLVRYYSKKHLMFLFLGGGFIGTALLDGYHAVLTSSQFFQRMPSPLESLIPWSWSASRTFLSLAMLCTWLGTTRRSPSSTTRYARAVIGAGATLALLALFGISLFPLPQAHFDGFFLSRPQELIPGLFFGIALVGFLSQKEHRSNSLIAWIEWSLLVAFAAQVAVMTRSAVLFDLPFNLAHLLKIFGYMLVLGGLLVDIYGTFRSLEESRERLEHLAEELKLSEDRFTRAIEGSTDGLWDYTVATGNVWYSDRFKQLLGFDGADEFPHRFESWRELLHPEDRDATLGALENHLQNGFVYDVQYRLRVKSGDYRWFRARGQAEWNREGTPIRMAGSLTDIHDQRTIEERLDLAIRAANEGLWDWEVSSGTTYFNDTFYTMLGYHPGEFPMTVEHWNALFHPEDKSSAMTALQEHLSGRVSTYRHEHRLRRKDGTWHWILGIGEIVEWDPQGRPKRMIGVHIDIQNIKEIALRLELAHSSARAGLWDWNIPAGSFVTNSTFHEMIGEEPIDGAAPLSFFLERLHSSDSEMVGRAIDAAHADDDYCYDIEFRFRCKDGSYKWIRSTGQVIERTPVGRPLRMIGQHIDITQQKELEVSLRESRNLTDMINQDLVGINIIQHVLFTCRRKSEVGDTISNVLVEKFDAQFAGLWLLAEDADDENDLQLISQSWSDEMLRKKGGQAELPQVPSLEGIARITDGWSRTVIEDLAQVDGELDGEWLSDHELRSFAGFPITLQGVVIGFIAHFSRDSIPPHRLETLELLTQMTAVAIRNVQQIDDLLTARRAAEQANLAKSEFLANMSHEIRTPMTAILGYADLLADGETEEQTISQEEALATIRTNGQHLLNIINDVLDMSKIEAGRMTVEKIVTNPVSIVREVQALMEPRARAKGIELQATSSTPVPVQIQSDPTRLRQILLNLVGNALKFTQRGSIRIVTELDESGSESARLRFSVIDTGIGMSAEQCDKIRQFDAFTQADGSTTREFGGSGLGLRISNALAQLLGGDIRLSSELGVGSTFTVTIPAGDIAGVSRCQVGHSLATPTPVSETDDADESATDTSRELRLSGMRILLVEDGPDNQRLISFLLRKEGAEVDIADNGRIAVEMVAAAAAPFDLILMDMQMPEMDGYAATRQLRAEQYEAPILALTANAMSDDRQKCLDAGCDEFLTKPVNREQLIDKCRHASRSASGKVVNR